ncbi:hypothetical protein RB195_015139 [Necator americanus]|uniref:Uncharacterized protein n=1 Tax=Necator americanus TaxID=51031 RepID=A0ABR1E375_NECAM
MPSYQNIVPQTTFTICNQPPHGNIPSTISSRHTKPSSPPHLPPYLPPPQLYGPLCEGRDQLMIPFICLMPSFDMGLPPPSGKTAVLVWSHRPPSMYSHRHVEPLLVEPPPLNSIVEPPSCRAAVVEPLPSCLTTEPMSSRLNQYNATSRLRCHQIPGPFKRHIKYRNEISSTAYSSEATEHAAEGTGTWSID